MLWRQFDGSSKQNCFLTRSFSRCFNVIICSTYQNILFYQNLFKIYFLCILNTLIQSHINNHCSFRQWYFSLSTLKLSLTKMFFKSCSWKNSIWLLDFHIKINKNTNNANFWRTLLRSSVEYDLFRMRMPQHIHKIHKILYPCSDICHMTNLVCVICQFWKFLVTIYTEYHKN